MSKPKLDLSKPNCHCCDNPKMRDMENMTEWCTHFACLIKNTVFNIPFVVEKIK